MTFGDFVIDWVLPISSLPLGWISLSKSWVMTRRSVMMAKNGVEDDRLLSDFVLGLAGTTLGLWAIITGLLSCLAQLIPTLLGSGMSLAFLFSAIAPVIALGGAARFQGPAPSATEGEGGGVGLDSIDALAVIETAFRHARLSLGWFAIVNGWYFTWYVALAFESLLDLWFICSILTFVGVLSLQIALIFRLERRGWKVLGVVVLLLNIIPGYLFFYVGSGPLKVLYWGVAGVFQGLTLLAFDPFLLPHVPATAQPLIV